MVVVGTAYFVVGPVGKIIFQHELFVVANQNEHTAGSINNELTQNLCSEFTVVRSVKNIPNLYKGNAGVRNPSGLDGAMPLVLNAIPFPSGMAFETGFWRGPLYDWTLESSIEVLNMQVSVLGLHGVTIDFDFCKLMTNQVSNQARCPTVEVAKRVDFADGRFVKGSEFR